MVNSSILKRHPFLICLFLLACAFVSKAQIKIPVTDEPTTSEVEDQHCGVMKRHNELLKTDAAYRIRRNQIDRHAKTFEQTPRRESAGGGVIVIPVVFHIIYNTDAQNISDDLVKAQIRQLNDDYRRVNTDRNATPTLFQGLASDIEIQFCLATRDPSGNPTTGITRTNTTKTSFSMTAFDAEKPNTIWDRDKYLNLWSVNLGNSLLGYAQFPGDVANTDGVVLLYSTIGSIDKPGTSANYPNGRTAAHEVGHWLNLYHIWGDDSGACTGSDNVEDTPNQANSTSGCGTFPKTDACTTTSPGVMYMNYMDYSHDNCLNMFTKGQKTRMMACLNGARSSLLTSNTCMPFTADYDVNANVGTQATCASSSLSYTVLTNALNAYSTNINLSLTNVPAGCTANLSSAAVSPGGSATVNVTVGNGVAAGFYNFWVKTESATTNTDSIALTFTVQSPTLSGAPTNLKPANNATAQSTTPLFTWNPVTDATLYDFQLSTDASFSNTLLTQSNLSTTSAFVPTATPLSNLTIYHWRVLAKNNCTSTTYATGSFTTGTITCLDFNSPNVPKPISAVGAPLVTSTITFPHSGTVTDINVTNINITHDLISDLTLTLRSPLSTNALLIDQPCDEAKAINMGFDDQTANAKGTYPCPPNDGKMYQPENFLTTFNGISATGLWTLRVKDNGDEDGGTLNAWSLRVCVNNIIIPVEMVDFKAKPLTQSIQLNWQTATERGNAGFEIQRSTTPFFAESRSTSGSTDPNFAGGFTKIGFVKGQGDASKLVDYQFIDKDIRLGTTYYYRLRQMDVEGKETFSKIEAANLDKDGVWDIALEPNPTEATLNVEILGKNNQTVTLDLYSIDGKLVLSKHITATENTRTGLDLAPLSNGIYMLKCRAGSHFFVKKVIRK